MRNLIEKHTIWKAVNASKRLFQSIWSELETHIQFVLSAHTRISRLRHIRPRPVEIYQKKVNYPQITSNNSRK